jgi:Ser/Thr protein kinase RdoA (MazF antagonist)
MFHWYAMDIDQALDSLQSEIAPDRYPRARDTFLDGYQTQFALDDDLVTVLPLFRRFAMLYRYTRLTRAVEERWENEPEWLVGLRAKLAGARASASEGFGKSL